MTLKCVYCDVEAEYFFKGSGYCREHLHKEQESGNLLSDDDIKNLEDSINIAVKKGCPSDVNFCRKNMYQTKYLQKYAEVKKTDNNFLFSIIIFSFSIGIGLVFASIGIISPSLWKKELPSAEINYTFLTLIFFGCVLFILGGVLLYFLWSPRQKTYDKIILKAERRIQDLSKTV
ncbi:Uncharacterised protein [uncultured archaeon]|nr:Uncharacterised protein [uncultured archaeon]